MIECIYNIIKNLYNIMQYGVVMPLINQ